MPSNYWVTKRRRINRWNERERGERWGHSTDRLQYFVKGKVIRFSLFLFAIIRDVRNYAI